MRASIRVRRSAATGIPGLVAVVLCGALNAQQTAMTPIERADIGSTVSVMELRIPGKAWDHFEKAKKLAGHNRLAESDVESEKAIAIAPDFAAAYLLRGSAEIQEHNFAAALVSISEARRIEPEALWAGVLLAGAYNGLNRYIEAEAVLDALQGQEAQSWQFDYEHARAAIGLTDASAALRWSALAVDAAPDSFADALVVRANSLVLAGRWREAESYLEADLHAKGPQRHRPEVLAALYDVHRRAREEVSSRRSAR